MDLSQGLLPPPPLLPPNSLRTSLPPGLPMRREIPERPHTPIAVLRTVAFELAVALKVFIHLYFLLVESICVVVGLR
jgi:hypothetical protein